MCIYTMIIYVGVYIYIYIHIYIYTHMYYYYLCSLLCMDFTELMGPCMVCVLIQKGMRNRTEPAELNRTEPLNFGTGRNRTEPVPSCLLRMCLFVCFSLRAALNNLYHESIVCVLVADCTARREVGECVRPERATDVYLRSSGMWCLRMCLIIIDATLSYNSI